ncbi:MAG: hypothetical protein K2X73_13335 [Sphingomonas sp.]|jgi:hypothetical protein|uniref:hypothetical protein n=1 Tax=Sphingomonas sp. TaxID=28214 RepID=UPI0025F461D6|nr:hypothetical protein [Sphingomonas sp.]MBX9882943.1 hypothetical protein [Sphingomonas sp.]
MRELTLEELELVAGGDDTGDIVVTGDRGGGDWGDFGDFGDFGDYGDYGDTGGGGGDSPPPPSCGGTTPSHDWSQNNPAVQSALRTANADEAGVDRAIANWSTIVSAANAHGIDPALLGAIAIRESDFQDINQIGGGLGRGVFQIDLGAHPGVTEAQANDLAWSADYAANLLATNMAELARDHPNFTHDQLTQATAASYNFGTGNISGNPSTIDVGTTGGNYGSNVQALMNAFKNPEYGSTPGAGPNNGGCG